MGDGKRRGEKQKTLLGSVFAIQIAGFGCYCKLGETCGIKRGSNGDESKRLKSLECLECLRVQSNGSNITIG